MHDPEDKYAHLVHVSVLEDYDFSDENRCFVGAYCGNVFRPRTPDKGGKPDCPDCFKPKAITYTATVTSTFPISA